MFIPSWATRKSNPQCFHLFSSPDHSSVLIFNVGIGLVSLSVREADEGCLGGIYLHANCQSVSHNVAEDILRLDSMFNPMFNIIDCKTQAILIVYP